MIKNCITGIYDNFIPDKRLRNRIEKTMTHLINNGTCIVNKLVNSHTEKIGIYRMLSNERFDYTDLLNSSYRNCTKLIDTNHVLAIHDTTEFNYHGISKKLTKQDMDIGPTGVDTIAGYFCHPMLIVNPNTSAVYGLSSAIFYNRDWNKKSKTQRNYKQLPIEEKESYRWIKSAQQTKSQIDSSIKLTIIGDRESDIYEEFYSIPDNRTNLLVRSRCDRKLVQQDTKLYDYLGNKPIEGSYELELSSNGKRVKRTAKIEIKFCEVSIDAPSSFKGEKKEIILTAIEARESSETIPKDGNSVLWRLLTTHKINSIDQAIQCVDWYKKRWLIEELFRVIKTKGFCIESSQLSSGSKLKKLLAMTLEAALTVMRLKLALNHNENLKNLAETIFTEQEQEFLEIMQSKVEGLTQKQKNPYPKKTLAWAAWTIARIAGWSGYSTHGPPGYITIKEGYDKFYLQLEGYLMFKNSM